MSQSSHIFDLIIQNDLHFCLSQYYKSKIIS